MKTFVLPGNSNGNAEWMKGLKKELTDCDLDLIEWPHWQTGNEADFSVIKEAERVATLIGQETVNVIAKSVGSVIAMVLINKYKISFNKIILCGIPLKGFRDETGQEHQDALSERDASQVKVFQNSADPYSRENC